HVIETWWRRLGAPGLVCLAVGHPPKTFFCQQESVDVDGFIRGHDDEHLFFCPHTFAPRPPIRRTKENSIACAGLWADLDAVDPSKLGALEPTIAIATSPKRYAGLWLTDGIAAIALNKRLTYHLGADKGGWCFTKLLRLPGSRNQKYRPPPLALVLWDDGPVHRLAELERTLPPLPQARVHAPAAHKGREGGFTRESGSEPEQILDRHHVGGWLRRQLLHGHQIGSERRYRMHMLLAHELHEAGVPAAEALVCLLATAWNKHETDGPVVAMVEKVWGRS